MSGDLCRTNNQVSLNSEGKYAQLRKQIQMTYSAQGVAESSACSKVGSTKLQKKERVTTQAWTIPNGKEGNRNVLHKLEGSPTPPGQLERSIKRIPKHHIVRTHRFQEPPSAATRKRRLQLYVPSQKINNAPDLNTPRNTLSLCRAEVRIASSPTTAAAMAIVVGRSRRSRRRTTSTRANKVQNMHHDLAVKHVRLNTVRGGRIDEVRNILQVLY